MSVCSFVEQPAPVPTTGPGNGRTTGTFNSNRQAAETLHRSLAGRASVDRTLLQSASLNPIERLKAATTEVVSLSPQKRSSEEARQPRGGSVSVRYSGAHSGNACACSDAPGAHRPRGGGGGASVPCDLRRCFSQMRTEGHATGLRGAEALPGISTVAAA